MNRYDLHTHSTASDGTLSPTALVRRAHARGVAVLALTDHDCTDGVAEAAAEADRVGLTLIPGVEVSVTWEGGQLVHIVGLRIDPDNAALQAGLSRLRAFRQWRAREMAQRLEAYGIPGTFEGAQALARGAVVSRTHFARFLATIGQGRDMNDAFERFLAPGKPGYVEGKWASLAECVDWIRGAGGQAVLAHPMRYALSAARLRLLLQQFHDCGGAGLELVLGGSHEAHTLAQYARTFGLAASVGSDFHGHDSSRLDVGLRAELPKQVRPIWEGW